jgi:hypothetical protein
VLILAATAMVLRRITGNGGVAGKLSGIVTCDGVPFTQGVVVLTNSDTGASYSAGITEDAHFRFVASRRAGVRDGDYGVSILPSYRTIKTGELVGPDALKVMEHMAVPAKYQSPETSGWCVSVTSTGETSLNLQMQSDTIQPPPAKDVQVRGK